MARGGKRPGAGRKKGTPNKATADIKAALQKHGPALVQALLDLTESENEQVRLAAVNSALDRAYGRPKQPVGGDDDGPPISVVHRIIVGTKDTDG